MTKEALGSLLIGAVVVGLVACGGGSADTAACTTGSGTQKTCVEYSSPNASAEAVQGITQACLDEGGTPSASCSHEGADGACRVKSTAPGVSQTVTTWVYAGNAATEMMACTSNGQTWISP